MRDESELEDEMRTRQDVNWWRCGSWLSDLHPPRHRDDPSFVLLVVRNLHLTGSSLSCFCKCHIFTIFYYYEDILH